MQLSEDRGTGLSIQHYESDSITIAGIEYRSSLLLNQHSVQSWDIDLSHLTLENFDVVLQQAPEIFIIGTGLKRVNINPEYFVSLMQARIGVEIMDTAAACRTFNILSAENRHIVAGFIL